MEDEAKPNYKSFFMFSLFFIYSDSNMNKRREAGNSLKNKEYGKYISTATNHIIIRELERNHKTK